MSKRRRRDLKEQVNRFLHTADDDGLLGLIRAEPRAMRFLLGRLWDDDTPIRRQAIAAIGVSAVAHPGLGQEVIRRLLWALNDESATNGVYGIAALGEIGYRNPQLMAPFVAPLASYMWDDGLRLEILQALCRIATSSPSSTRPAQSILERYQQGSPTLPERKCLTKLLGDVDLSAPADQRQ